MVTMAATHEVMKPFTAMGRDLERGDVVDASSWPPHRVGILAKYGSLRALPSDVESAPTQGGAPASGGPVQDAPGGQPASPAAPPTAGVDAFVARALQSPPTA